MRMIVVLLICLSTSSLAFAVDAGGKFTVLSLGTNSCGDVVEANKKARTEKLHNSIWVAGYLTAINERVSSKSNIAAGTNPAAWDLWIFNYCSSSPLQNLHDATAALVKELSKKSL